MSETQHLLESQGRPRILRNTKDPLLRLAGRRIAAEKEDRAFEEESGDPGQPELRILFLVAAPFALFLFTVSVVACFFNYWPFWVLLTTGLAVVKAILVLQFFRRRRWQRYLGRFLLAAAAAGVVVGLYAYYRHLVFYFHYRDMQRHANVAPSEPAEMYADSGMLQFTSDTRVDGARSVGYRSAQAGETLCVAPVVDSIMRPGDDVFFFAAGVGCCAWRAQFNCGDAGDAQAGGGLLRLEAQQIVSPATAWLVDDPVIREGFKHALDLAHAAYNTKVGTGARLLHWAKDPMKLQDKHLWKAIGTISAFAAMLLAANVVAAVYVVGGRGKQKQRLPSTVVM